MRININTSAVNTHRIMTQNSQRQDKNLERLASGLKINRGADGPAQLQVSERLRSQVAGLGQAIDNSENAVSVLQTAEAALDEVSTPSGSITANSVTSNITMHTIQKQM